MQKLVRESYNEVVLQSIEKLYVEIFDSMHQQQWTEVYELVRKLWKVRYISHDLITKKNSFQFLPMMKSNQSTEAQHSRQYISVKVFHWSFTLLNLEIKCRDNKISSY